jgi:hypothetical protein
MNHFGQKEIAMDDGGFLDWRQLYQVTLNDVKDLVQDLPTGPERNEIERKVRNLDDELARADAQLAKQLGLHLCDCTWPPQIMQWREQEHAHVCPNLECGRRRERPRATQISRDTSWVRARNRRGGGDGTGWMGN